MPSPTLILAAHGAGDGSDANQFVESLAARVRSARPGVEVLPAYNLGTPRFPEALSAVSSDRAVLVPLMTGRGYFVDERLPAELAKSPRYGQVRLAITPPLGTSSLLVDELLERSVGTFAALGSPTVLVVAHGTTRNPASRTAALDLAGTLAGRLPSGAAIHTTFLDDHPLLEDLGPTLPPAPILVVPWLLGGGGHHQNDIRERLGEAFERTTVLPALAELSNFTDAVLRLFDDAGGDQT
jgi:sirohydrochlorin ferrochelatase